MCLECRYAQLCISLAELSRRSKRKRTRELSQTAPSQNHSSPAADLASRVVLRTGASRFSSHHRCTEAGPCPSIDPFQPNLTIIEPNPIGQTTTKTGSRELKEAQSRAQRRCFISVGRRSSERSARRACRARPVPVTRASLPLGVSRTRTRSMHARQQSSPSVTQFITSDTLCNDGQPCSPAIYGSGSAAAPSPLLKTYASLISLPDGQLAASRIQRNAISVSVRFATLAET